MNMRKLMTGLLLLMACKSSAPNENSVRVDLRTDLVPLVEFDTIRLEFGEGDLSERSDRLVEERDDFLRGQRIGDGNAPLGPLPIEVTLYRSGRPFISRRVVALVDRDLLSVTIVISRNCEGVMCPNDNPAFDSCLGGRCVDPRCTVETPEFCPAPECESNDDCESSGTCTEASCNGQTCFLVPNDAMCGAGERCDIRAGCVPEGAIVDAGLDGAMDAGLDAAFDAPMVDSSDMSDAGPLHFACDPLVDEDTIFLFDFDDESDSTGRGSGINTAQLAVTSPTHPCGATDGVLEIAGLDTPHFRVPPRAEFNDDDVSVDFWINAPSGGSEDFAIISRDASGITMAGHLSIFWSNDDEIVVRHQMPPGRSVNRCTGTLTPGWHRIGVHVTSGILDVYVDRGISHRSGTVDIGMATYACDDTFLPIGIAGNDNPFVFGVNVSNSDEGTHLPMRTPFIGLMLDKVRLSHGARPYEAELYP